MRIGISTSLVDDDAVNLVEGVISDVTVECIISTREHGENPLIDRRLERLEKSGITVIAVSARKNGRIKKRTSVTNEDISRYDEQVMKEVVARTGRLPEVMVMLGDMIIHGKKWCSTMASLNLHPDLPLYMGGKEGIYWDVIGQWVKDGRKEGGGMMLLAVPTLDAGTPVAYFRIPLRGVVNGVDLGQLRRTILPESHDALEALIRQQVELKEAFTDPYFRAVRRAEASFEPGLIQRVLVSLSRGEIRIKDGKVTDFEGIPTLALDLTDQVVGDLAVWPDKEGQIPLKSKERGL